ncbi:bacteriophage DNA methylase [Achromobacter arsenitoxydans SY8]|uniref:Bacteriophage DNA methylase n=2 Tax=Achromobacter TaxID=222 RepID=H0F735_9BURK|nr:bacteriophage DNA methylase [Achromobacter arsenitoxydans SY8]
MALSSHQSARMKNDEWLTPPGIVAALGTFDLDPCAPEVRPWSTAHQHYTVADNGLQQTWKGRVWCNPPFGREAVKWLRKMAAHGDGVALIPARTETAMFYECVWDAADAVLFIEGRPHFHYVDGTRAPFNSGAPICLVAYGLSNVAALERSGLGVVLPIPRRRVGLPHPKQHNDGGADE